MLTKTNGVSV